MWIPEIKANGVITYPCACEVKFDGEFVRWNGEALYNKRNEVKKATTLFPSYTLYGELYYGEGKEFYSELHSHQNDANNKVIIFDTENYGLLPYSDRRRFLDNHKEIPSVPYKVVYNKEELNTYFDEIIRQGHEGIVVKPLASLTDRSWVKMKREYTCTLLVKGLRKDRINTIAVGTQDKVLGCCSLLGWDIVRQMIVGERPRFNKEDKEILYFNSAIKLEIKHNGIIESSGKLRHPRIKRVRHYSEEVDV